MNISELYEMQRELDNRICKEHRLEGMNLVPSKILALQVELGELANETRCFKFWSSRAFFRGNYFRRIWIVFIYF